MAKVKGQNIPSEFVFMYSTSMQPATFAKDRPTNHYNAVIYGQTKYASAYYVRMRYPYRLPIRQGRDDLNSATIQEIASGAHYEGKRKRRGTPSAAQLWERNKFLECANYFSKQPKTGGWDGVSVGPRGRDWWHAQAIDSGLLYPTYFFKQTMPPLIAGDTPDWCKLTYVSVQSPPCSYNGAFVTIFFEGRFPISNIDSILLNGTPATSYMWVNSSHIYALFTCGMPEGDYTITISFHNGPTLTLTDTLHIYQTITLEHNSLRENYPDQTFRNATFWGATPPGTGQQEIALIKCAANKKLYVRPMTGDTSPALSVYELNPYSYNAANVTWNTKPTPGAYLGTISNAYGWDNIPTGTTGALYMTVASGVAKWKGVGAGVNVPCTC